MKFLQIPTSSGSWVAADASRYTLRDITAATVRSPHPQIEAADEAAAAASADLTRWADPDPARALSRAKAAKLNEINSATAAALSSGAAVTGEAYGPASGVVFGITETDQSQWVAALSALANAEKVLATDIGGHPGASYLGPLLNRAGQPVDGVTVSQFRAVMLGLTQVIGTIRGAHASRRAALAAATTVEDVETIEI